MPIPSLTDLYSELEDLANALQAPIDAAQNGSDQNKTQSLIAAQNDLFDAAANVSALQAASALESDANAMATLKSLTTTMAQHNADIASAQQSAAKVVGVVASLVRVVTALTSGTGIFPALNGAIQAFH